MMSVEGGDSKDPDIEMAAMNVCMRPSSINSLHMDEDNSSNEEEPPEALQEAEEVEGVMQAGGFVFRDSSLQIGSEYNNEDDDDDLESATTDLDDDELALLLQRKSKRKKLTEQVQHALYTSPPIEMLKIFPEEFVVTFGVTIYAVMAAIYLVFFIQGYHDRLAERYISLDNTVGDCSEVATAVDTTFLASSTGAWQGKSDFAFSQAIYEYTFSDLEVTRSEFQNLVEEEFSVESLGKRMKQQPFADNLLVWMSYRDVVERDGQLQQFQLAGTPSDVFNRRYMNGWAANATSDCLASLMTYDITTSILRYEFPFTAECEEYLNPLISTRLLSTSLQTSIKLNSLITAEAVNHGLLALDLLEYVKFVQDFKYGGDSFRIDSYYDARWQRSDLIYCVTPEDEDDADKYAEKYRWMPIFCFVEQMNTPLLPQFYHYQKECLQCDGSKNLDSCNDFDMAVGFLYINDADATIDEKLSELLDLLESTDSNAELNLLVNGAVANLDDKTLFDRCPKCVGLIANMWDDFKQVTPNFYEVENAHCADSVTLSSDAYAHLVDTQPTTLVEDYYECKDYPFEAFWYATALAFGDTGTMAPFALLLLLPLMYLYVRLRGFNMTKRDKYSIIAQEQILGDIAGELLRIQGGDFIGISDAGTVDKLTSQNISRVNSPKNFSRKSSACVSPSAKSARSTLLPPTSPHQQQQQSQLQQQQQLSVGSFSSIPPVPPQQRQQQQQQAMLGKQASRIEPRSSLLLGERRQSIQSQQSHQQVAEESNVLLQLALAINNAKERRERAKEARKVLFKEAKRSDISLHKMHRATSIKMLKENIQSQRRASLQPLNGARSSNNIGGGAGAGGGSLCSDDSNGPLLPGNANTSSNSSLSAADPAADVASADPAATTITAGDVMSSDNDDPHGIAYVYSTDSDRIPGNGLFDLNAVAADTTFYSAKLDQLRPLTLRRSQSLSQPRDIQPEGTLSD